MWWVDGVVGAAGSVGTVERVDWGTTGSVGTVERVDWGAAGSVCSVEKVDWATASLVGTVDCGAAPCADTKIIEPVV